MWNNNKKFGYSDTLGFWTDDSLVQMTIKPLHSWLLIYIKKLNIYFVFSFFK